MQLPLAHLRGVVQAMRRGRTITNWEQIGDGHFSRVYQNKVDFPDIVLKVSGRSRYGWRWGKVDMSESAVRDGWPEYAEFCRRWQHVAGVPIVHHVEKLSGSLYWGVLGACRSSYGRTKEPDPSWYINVLNMYNFGGPDEAKDVPMTPQEQECYDEFVSMFDIVDLDIHDDNIMICCATGQRVITDPIAWSMYV